ncbi:hypothetical protein TNCV_2607311 [Trichonephila clavipes]|uniref:Uncharacterized protein n=1 Tax=Trichonephila clavipes TaxID=2585209 RepID=A0A8X6RTL4_TRICX|nr:hypothetical protein TNCV_2607311 [Trichonephila clavipes]
MHHGEKKGAIASRRLDLYLLVRGRYFISLLPPIGNQWRHSPPGDAPSRDYRLPRGYHLLVVVVVLVSMNKCIMEKKRCHSLQEVGLVPVGPRKEVGLVPVGPRKVFYFLLPPIGNQWIRSPPGDAPSRGYRLPRGYHLLVVVVVLVSMNKCIMEKKRCHSLQEVGLVPVGPRKVFYFPSTTHWKPMEAFPTWGRTL